MRTTAPAIVLFVFAFAPLPQAQGTAPATPLTLISRDGRRALPTTMLSGQELIALDDVASLFGVAVREDALAGGVTVTYRGRSVVASLDQPMVLVNGNVVSLPAPVVRSGRRSLVPVEFLSRALGPIYDQRIELRRPSRLLIVGDLRVPRVTARIDAPGPPTRATIEISPAAPAASVIDGARVITRIEADALDLALPSGGGGLIEQIRAGDQANTVTIALVPAAGTARTSISTADNATRITIDIPPAVSAAPPEPSALPPPASPPPPAPATGGGLALPSRAFRTVVVDAGHGGSDVGVRGPGGLEEKQLTLDVARRLRGLIEARLGLRVVLTRDDDRNVGLDERAAVANNSKGDLFLSLHANAAPAPALSGAEVLHLRVNPNDARGGLVEGPALPVLGGGTRSLDIVRWDLAQARHLESSAVLAGILDDELRRRLTMSPRGVQEAPIRVLTAANMPAAVVEMAYLTNPDQEAQATKGEFRDVVAQALYEAVVRYRAYADQRQR